MEPDWNGTVTNLEFKSLTEYLTREVFKRLIRWKWHKAPTMTKTMIDQKPPCWGRSSYLAEINHALSSKGTALFLETITVTSRSISLKSRAQSTCKLALERTTGYKRLWWITRQARKGKEFLNAIKRILRSYWHSILSTREGFSPLPCKLLRSRINFTS